MVQVPDYDAFLCTPLPFPADDRYLYSPTSYSSHLGSLPTGPRGSFYALYTNL